MGYVRMPVEDYIELLYERKDEVCDRQWYIPDPVWDYVEELIKDTSEYIGSPSYVIDNIAVNGDYGPVRNYPSYAGKTRAELEDEVMLVYEEDGEVCILLSLGI